MAWVQSADVLNSSGGSSAAITLGASAFNALFLLYGWVDATVDSASISDNAGNSYTIISPTLINAEYYGLAYCTTITGAPTTLTLTTSSTHGNIVILADMYTTGWAFSATSSGTTAGAGTAAPAALTPAVNNCLIWGAAAATGAGGCASHSGNGFTPRIQNFSSAWATQDQTQTTATITSATFDVGSTGIAFQMVFSPVALTPLMGAICM